MSKSKFMNFSKIQLNFPGIHEFFLRNYSRTHTERIVWNDKVYRLDYTKSKNPIQSGASSSSLLVENALNLLPDL